MLDSQSGLLFLDGQISNGNIMYNNETVRYRCFNDVIMIYQLNIFEQGRIGKGTVSHLRVVVSTWFARRLFLYWDASLS